MPGFDEAEPPSAGYEEVYAWNSVDTDFEDTEISEKTLEQEEYETAKNICQQLEEIFQATDTFYIFMAEDQGLTTVAESFYDRPTKVHPDLQMDYAGSNLDCIDLVLTESGYRQELLEMFEETVYEEPETEVFRDFFSEDTLLQGCWLAPGLEELYNFEEIKSYRENYTSV